MSKSIQRLSRQLQPVVRIINQIEEEDINENLDLDDLESQEWEDLLNGE